MSAPAILALLAQSAGDAGGANGSGSIQLGLGGMLALFGGLVLLAVLTPALRKLVGAKKEAPAVQAHGPSESPEAAPGDEEVAAAVCAIHAHLSQIEQIEHLHLTWGMYDKPYRPWRLAGRAELLLGRQGVQARSRNRSV